MRKVEKIRKVNRFKFLSDLKFRLIVEGTIVGVLAGVVVSLFRLILSKVDDIRSEIIEFSKMKFSLGLLAIFILLVLLGLVALIRTREPLTGGSGIPQVKGEIVGNVKSNWLRVLVLKFFGGILAISSGLSLGREGPSIQLGAMVGKGYSRLTGRLTKEEKYLIMAGAGAGLAAAFSAPLAGMIFVLEEIKRKISHKALLSTMASAITADWIASRIFGLSPVFNIELKCEFPLKYFYTVIFLGLITGALGALYNKSINFMQDLLKPITKNYMVWPLTALIIIVLAIYYPKVLGSGHSLVEDASLGNFGLGAILVLLVIKFIFSVYSFSTGAPGGIFLPLLVLGGLIGCLFSELIIPVFGMESDIVAYFVIFGMAGYFSAIVRAPITGIILISEMTGMDVSLLALAIVSLISYVTAELLGARPIYDQLLDRLIESDPKLRKNGEKYK